MYSYEFTKSRRLMSYMNLRCRPLRKSKIGLLPLLKKRHKEELSLFLPIKFYFRVDNIQWKYIGDYKPILTQLHRAACCMSASLVAWGRFLGTFYHLHNFHRLYAHTQQVASGTLRGQLKQTI